MAHDADRSPTGWYLGSYLLRFVELKDPRRNDPEARFPSWENTVLVKAPSLKRAADKVAKIGRSNSKTYLGGKPPGVPVKWEFLGVTAVVPIYEPLTDGAEVAWQQHAPRKLRLLRQRVDSPPRQPRARSRVSK
jgi:hypothetical protein